MGFGLSPQMKVDKEKTMSDRNRYIATVTKSDQFDLTAGVIEDIVITAIEGGVNYWVRKIDVDRPEGCKYYEAIPNGGSITFFPFEDDECYVLKLSNFLKGYKMAAEHFDQTLEDFYENHDADGADLVVQFALFDQIVYG